MKKEHFYLAINIEWNTNDEAGWVLPDIVSLNYLKNASLEEVNDEADEYLFNEYGFPVYDCEIREVDKATYYTLFRLETLQAAIQKDDKLSYSFYHGSLGDIDKSILNMEWFTDPDNIIEANKIGHLSTISYKYGFEILVR